jgi:cell division protein FtsN
MDYGSRYNAFRFQEAVAKEKRDALAQMHADSEAQPQPSESDREEEEDEEEEQEEHAEAASNAASSAGAAPPPQPPVLLVALCGLPAAGKSLLAQDVTKDRPESWVKNGEAPFFVVSAGNEGAACCLRRRCARG